LKRYADEMDDTNPGLRAALIRLASRTEVGKMTDAELRAVICDKP
jgi:hypothetical protein